MNKTVFAAVSTLALGVAFAAPASAAAVSACLITKTDPNPFFVKMKEGAEAKAKELGVPTLLNPAPAAADLDVARLADLAFLTPNETELATLTGLPVGNEHEAEVAARSLTARGIGTVVVTMGGRGALLVDAGGTRRVAPVKVEPVDTTGAAGAEPAGAPTPATRSTADSSGR